MGGTALADRSIRLAQAPLVPDRRPSRWSHAFIIEGTRIDGALWVLESDLGLSRGQWRNGVQENRIDKYADPAEYPNVAVLDFGLDGAAGRRMIVAGLDLVSRGTRYAAGGVLSTFVAILRKRLDKERERDDTFCSSFVRTLYKHVGIDLTPGVAVRHTTPEHLVQTTVRHRRHRLIRD